MYSDLAQRIDEDPLENEGEVQTNLKRNSMMQIEWVHLIEQIAES